MPSSDAEHGRVMRDYHMPSDDFRRHGRMLVDWVADYLDQVGEYSVFSQVKPGDIRSMLPNHPPERGEPFEAMLADVKNIIVPGLTHWQSPGFHAFFPSNNSGPSILGELLTAGLGVQGMLWLTSPACTELETHVLDWMVELLGLPEHFRSDSTGGGVLQDTASSAVLVALLAARERATGWRVNATGMDRDRRLTVYASRHSHSSVEKAVKIAGLGSESLRLIEVDEQSALKPDLLELRVEQDRAANHTPCLAVATVGTTSTHGIDPVRQMGETCRRHGIWLHVDAAHAGTAAVCPEFRWIHDGLELADSYCFNPHKWMFVNFDCDAFWVADRSALIRTMNITPEYLHNEISESGQVIDYRDWQIPLGRRFRALKLWFTIRHYGVEGLRHHIREHVALAQSLAERLRADPRFDLVAPVPLTLICFRHTAGDAATRALHSALNDTGEVFLSTTELEGKPVIRISIGAASTGRAEIERLWELVDQLAAPAPA